MKTRFQKLMLMIAALCFTAVLTAQENGEYAANYAHAPRFKALLHYEPGAEEAHVQFDKQAIQFFHKLTYGEGWILDVTTSLADYPYEKLKEYSIIISLNASPGGAEQREAFEKYMENGGGWIGFHASGYNDRNTKWPWFNRFLGCGAFYCNNWPPQPALVECETQEHPVTCSLPQSFVAPASEFYQWQPSPRKNPDVEVLLSISPKMYPFGLKDVVKFGDFPIVWTNTKYRMVYLNMGHGDEGFIDASQNLLFVNAFRWVVSRDPQGDPFKK
jgi:type 1 glutamine amidotransferase